MEVEEKKPGQIKSKDEHEDEYFSMSSYEGEQTDSLIIKPPQVKLLHKRDKKDKRRRKEKHKDRQKNRDRSRPDEHKRERRRHRDPEKRESKRDKHKEKGLKRHHSNDARKLEKERKLVERGHFNRDRMNRERDEVFVVDDTRHRPHGIRGRYRDLAHPYSRGARRHHHVHEDRNFSAPDLMDLSISPHEKSDREKRMERLLIADKQKEITQREVDERRLKKEDSKGRREEERENRTERRIDKEEEARIEVLRQRAEASMLRHTTGQAVQPKKPSFDADKDISVEIISDEEDEMVIKKDLSTSNKVINIENDDKNVAQVDKNDKSSSENESSDSESSSTSSESSSEDDEHAQNKKEDKKKDKTSPKSASLSDLSSSDDSTYHPAAIHDSDAPSDLDSLMPSPPDHEKLPVYYPATMGCRSVDEFECLNRIEEGTYGVVYRAREKSTDQIVALKRLKMEKEREGFPITSLREVNTLLKGQHENIVTVREIVVGSNMDKIYIVMDYVEHDLKSLMETMKKKKQVFTIGEVKTLMIQLLRAINHLHDNWILHRDIKTSNLLLSHRGILKVGDFGLAREYGSPLKGYTPIVVTLWYRAPELLLGTKLYSCPIDVWSTGCIFGELLGMEPMFPGKSDIDQLNKIFKDLGTPSEEIWPGFNDFPVTKKTQFAYYPYNRLKERFKNKLSTEAFNLFNKFLTYNPAKRITCLEALEHDYFTTEDPPPIDPSMFPTWPAKSENPHGSRSKKGDSPKPPSGGKKFKDLMEDDNVGFFLGGAPNSGPGFTLKF